MLRAGTLNTLCLLQKPGAGIDELGQPIPGSWETVAEVWCDPVSLSGVEVIRAGADTSIVNVSMRMRRRRDVTNAMRLVEKFGGTIYQITSAWPDSRDRSSMFAACKVVT